MTLTTLLLRVDPENPSMENIRTAAYLIKRGGIVAFPTETVYGLGADVLNPAAVLRVFQAKKRPLDNPPIIHVSQEKDVNRLARSVPLKASVLIREFWPGPLTLILKRSAVIPNVAVSGLDTVAIRMPENKIALALIEESGCSIAAPSANLAGKPSPTTAKHVLDDLDTRIDAVLDGGPTKIGLESTVVDLTCEPPEVLRPGGISFESLKRVIRNVKLSRFAVADRASRVGKARSPGIRHKHYSPNAEVWVVEGNIPSMTAKMQELASAYHQDGRKVGVLATEETKDYYDASSIIKSLGSRYDLEGLAKRLFDVLRKFDEEKVDVIIAEGLPTEGLGLAIMNRLRRAAAFKIVKADD
jgi:L-threonylcarbamoyladenylate synthase